MSKWRGWEPWSALALVTVAVLVLSAVEAPLAAKKYKTKDLKGTYNFVVTESRVVIPDPLTWPPVPPLEIQYCDQYGTIWFDGHGHAESTLSLRRCTTLPSGVIEIDVDDLGAFNYVVYENGEFLLIELDDLGVETDYITHGRITQKGKLLLVDGTRGCMNPTANPDPPPPLVNCPHPEFIQTIAVGAKE